MVPSTVLAAKVPPFLRLSMELRLRIYHYYAQDTPQALVKTVGNVKGAWVAQGKQNLLKTAAPPPPLFMANKVIAAEYRAGLQNMKYGLCIVEIGPDAHPLFVTPEKLGWPTIKKLAVDMVQVNLWLATHADKFEENVPYVDILTERLKRQLDSVGAFLNLCEPVAKFQLRFTLACGDLPRGCDRPEFYEMCFVFAKSHPQIVARGVPRWGPYRFGKAWNELVIG